MGADFFSVCLACVSFFESATRYRLLPFFVFNRSFCPLWSLDGSHYQVSAVHAPLAREQESSRRRGHKLNRRLVKCWQAPVDAQAGEDDPLRAGIVFLSDKAKPEGHPLSHPDHARAIPPFDRDGCLLEAVRTRDRVRTLHGQTVGANTPTAMTSPATTKTMKISTCGYTVIEPIEILCTCSGYALNLKAT